ncbi:collagenase [Kitasatospora sp. NPDC002965]
MYEEGDPSKAGNQARFIAHEADWLRQPPDRYR